jgi:hypothetical protein
MVVPEPYPWFSFGQHAANRLAWHLGVHRINPGVRTVRAHQNCDVFVAICQFPRDLLKLNALKGWRRWCRKSVCWLAEVWARQVGELKGHLKLLAQFDLVVIPSYDSVEPIRNAIDTACVYLPPGVDAITFSPYPAFPPRSVDVYGMGRKSASVHESLLEMAREGRIFYIYDTIRNKETVDYKQHRDLVANIAKRSRYFLANAPKIDKQSQTGGQREISYRFLEGAASGAVMLGEPGESYAFRKHFDWPDAVIRVPYDARNIAQILAELDGQEDRLNEIRKNGVVNCLRRHDWVYRWHAVLDILGLEPRPALVAREKRLAELAEQVTRLYAHHDTPEYDRRKQSPMQRRGSSRADA